MARAIPYLFCRYELIVGDEVLDSTGQLEALKELQGTYYPHGRKAEEDGLYDSVVMRPRRFALDGEEILTWSVGQLIGGRVTALYDRDADELKLQYQPDDSLKYADFVSVPSLGVLAVDDRLGDTRLGGRAAANRFRSIFRQLHDAQASVVVGTEYADLQRALERWQLTAFMFTVRPHNPHSPSAIARKLGESLKKRNVARERGVWNANPGEGIKPDDEMQGIIDLSEAGYGQVALKGVTPGGHEAQIKKPPFYPDADRNLASQTKPREMRVYIETEDERVVEVVANALMQFYGE